MAQTPRMVRGTPAQPPGRAGTSTTRVYIVTTPLYVVSVHATPQGAAQAAADFDESARWAVYEVEQ